MLYNAEENTLNLVNTQIDYITFGKGAKPLVKRQRILTKEYTISLANKIILRMVSSIRRIYCFSVPEGRLALGDPLVVRPDTAGIVAVPGFKLIFAHDVGNREFFA